METPTSRPAQLSHPTVPRELAGRWIAWNREMTKIIASGATFTETLKAARDRGESAPVLGKSPPANQRMIGVALS